MSFDFSIFDGQRLETDYIDWLVEEHSVDVQRHFSRLWEYYANRMIEV